MATAAERAQQHRDRKRRGVMAVVPVEVDMDVLIALVRKDYLDPDATDDACNVTDKSALAEAVQAALGDLAEEADREWQAEEEAGAAATPEAA